LRIKPLTFLAAGACSLLVSCAFITVYVYFPEKDVKKAFKTLDDKYLGEGTGAAPSSNGTPQPAQPPSTPEEPSRQ
jgi:hypothetical protein